MHGSRPYLLPEDRHDFERVLDGALRLVERTARRDGPEPRLNGEQLRTMALNAVAVISAAAASEYQEYVRVREELRGCEAVARRRPVTTLTCWVVLLAVLCLAVLCLAVSVVFAVNAASLVPVGVGFGAAAVSVAAGSGVARLWADRGTPARDDQRELAAGLSFAQERWRAALLERGMLPFLHEALAGDTPSPGWYTQGGARSWGAPGTGYARPDFTSPDFTSPDFPAPDFPAPGFPAPGHGDPQSTSFRTRPSKSRPARPRPGAGSPGTGVTGPATPGGGAGGPAERESRPAPAGREPGVAGGPAPGGPYAVPAGAGSPGDVRPPEDGDEGAPAPVEAGEPRRLTAELAEQAPPGREVPLHVQVVHGGGGGAALRAFALPEGGVRLLITVHAPGLLALGDLQQELSVRPGQDSDVLRFGLATSEPGLHTVTVRAFHGGTFLGELRAQISVEPGTPARDGPRRSAPLPTVAFDPGEVTLQVLKGTDGSYSFQLISETCYAPESFRMLAGDPRGATERIYDELRRAAAAAGGPSADEQARRRLRNLGVQLWADAVPDAVRRQFWEEADRVTALTVLGEHDAVPWELLYPLDGHQEGEGFLTEWLPVVRRVFGQDRVRELSVPRAAFVVPPGSPPEADREIAALRARLGEGVADGGTLTRRAAVSDLIEDGLDGVLHFACHNAFTAAGSHVAMEDGPFDPVDLAYAVQSGALRKTHPLVFFNACRSAGQIDWFSTSMGWAPQFLRAGAGAFVGTLWPVRSATALTFADAFYQNLVTEGRTLGQASLDARRAIRDRDGDPTWLAYTVYGSPAARAAVPSSP